MQGFDKLKVYIFNSFEDGNKEWAYDKFNVPIWKHLDEHNNTLVRGISPRINQTFIHIFLENCIDRIDCIEITEKDVQEMD